VGLLGATLQLLLQVALRSLTALLVSGHDRELLGRAGASVGRRGKYGGAAPDLFRNGRSTRVGS
jgi:hypothetical protein